MVWKQATDMCAGDATKYGAPDVVKISQLFSDTDVTDTVTIHESVAWTFQSDVTTGDSIRISNPAQTFNYNIRAGAIVAQRDIILPVLGADDTVAFNNTAATFMCKTFDLTCNTLTGTSLELKTAISDETGSGSLVFATSPVLVTPALGTPSALVLTNATELPVSGLANGTDGELITWSACAVATTVATGSCGQVLTSNGAGAAPTFQCAGAGDNLGNHTATTCLLMGTNAIQFGIDAAAPAACISYHTVLAAGHVYNAITCDIHDFKVNAVSQMTISATQIDFQANALIDGTLDLANITVTGSLAEFNTALQCESFAILGANTFTGTQTLGCQTLTFNAGQTIAGDAGGLTYVVPACDTHEFNRCVNLTAGTVQEGGVDISPIGTHTQWIPAGAWGARTTNGAVFAELELATNDIMLQTFDFDQTTSEGVQFWWEPPAEWNAGTITFNAKWTAASGAGTVTWELSGHSYTNDDAIDVAIGGTPGSATDTLLLANDMHISPESGNVTIAGATKGEAILLQLRRDIADTLTADAKLIGINITYTSDEATAT
jgi:hypothetical protein